MSKIKDSIFGDLNDYEFLSVFEQTLNEINGGINEYEPKPYKYNSSIIRSTEEHNICSKKRTESFL